MGPALPLIALPANSLPLSIRSRADIALPCRTRPERSPILTSQDTSTKSPTFPLPSDPRSESSKQTPSGFDGPNHACDMAILTKETMLLLAIIALVRFANQRNRLPIDVIRRTTTTVRFALAAIALGMLPHCSECIAFAQQITPGFTAPSPSTTSPGPNANPSQFGKLLREGTLIPPTVGTIVSVGRRWGFTITPNQVRSQQNAQGKTSSGSNIETSKLFGRQIGESQRARISITNVATAGSEHVQIVEIEQRTEGAASLSAQINQGTNQTIVLAENLMLQRIVEAVVADPTDDCWTISGEIMEFRNQNRLLIDTAQRTNQN